MYYHCSDIVRHKKNGQSDFLERVSVEIIINLHTMNTISIVGHCGLARLVVGCMTTYAISAYHH
jgi:hypothetical protein